MKTASPRLPVFFVFLLGCLVSSTKADTLRTVAFSGNPAAGTSATFLQFKTPVLNNAGQTAFTGLLSGSEVDDNNRDGLWSEGGGLLALVARTGNAAPGTNVSFANLYSPVFDDTGQTAFRGRLTSSTDDGIWSEGSGSLDLVAREGVAAPGINAVFRNIGNPALNHVGKTAFIGIFTGPEIDRTNDSGIWSERGGSLALLARAGNTAPGTSADFNSFKRVGDPVFNGTGQTAFRGWLTGPDVIFSSNDTGIWSEGGGSLALVARAGNAAPDTSAVFSSLGSPVLNNMGRTAFTGRLIGPDIVSRNDGGIWSEGSGSLALVAREGSEAPGTNANFISLDSPVLNAAGHTAFSGSLTGPGIDNHNASGIWSEGGGSLTLVARAGDAAPGTNATFNHFSRIIPSLNSAGQTAFAGRLVGPEIDGSNDRGIWAQDPLGVLTLIAREGDLLDVDDGPETDFRTIRFLHFAGGTGNEDGRASSFNDLGQLAFIATFTNGSSGIFVSNLVAVPEPSSLALLTLAGLAMLRRGALRD